MDLKLLPLALGPAALLVHVMWWYDRPRREPVWNLLRYVVAGAVSAVLALAVSLALAPVHVAIDDPAVGGGTRLIAVFGGVGLVEEGCKLLCLVLAAARDRVLDEPFDWIVYAVAVSLGFAAVENLRVLWDGADVGWARAVTAVPGHGFLGTMMGFELARATRDGRLGEPRPWLLALLVPTAWHTAYDFFLYQAHFTGSGIMSFLFNATLGLEWRVAVFLVQRSWHSEKDREPPILLPERFFAGMLARLRRRFGGSGPRDPGRPTAPRE